MDWDLNERLALVSGGSRGIGAAIAEAFVREGCRVVVAARSRDSLQGIKRRLGDACEIYPCDATDPREAAATLTAVDANHGGLDFLVTCVGSGASVAPGTETFDEWVRVLGVNLLSATNMVQASAALLSRSPVASIVCISSICGVEALGAPVTYSAGKAALAMAVKGWSRPFAKMGIRINAVSPGNVFTEGGTWDRKMRADPDGVAAMLAREVPMGRFGSPEEIARAVLFLASPLAGFVTGANLVVDGGQTRSV
jgi:3-oxoacyl-[acyl-carrier protein] reductase